MRLPISKVYRAFPELDRFSDAECRAYVQRAVKRHWMSMILVGIGAVAAMILVWSTYFAVVGVLSSVFGLGHLARSSQWGDLVIVLTVVGGVASGPVVALMIRDFWLRRAIAKQLTGTRCHLCEYQLIGLQVSGGAVQCPECGTRTILADFGLVPADLLAAPEEERGGPRS